MGTLPQNELAFEMARAVKAQRKHLRDVWRSMSREEAAAAMLEELELCNPALMKWHLGDMLRRLPGIGKEGVSKLLQMFRISYYQTYQELDVYARYRLLTWLLKRSDPSEIICNVGKGV